LAGGLGGAALTGNVHANESSVATKRMTFKSLRFFTGMFLLYV
jgi:hypothetical protein